MSDDHDPDLEEDPIPRLSWERPHYRWGSDLFVPQIADLAATDGFNTLKISLDGRKKASLDWTEAKRQAADWIVKDSRNLVFWEIDLGLFSDLEYPLSNQTQYLSLGLSLDHFRQTLWQEFHERTIGLSLYRGPLDFSQEFPWDEGQIHNLQEWLQDRDEVWDKLAGSDARPETLRQTEWGKRLLSLFCRDVSIDYLNLLLGMLPDALQPFLLLDASTVRDELTCALLLHRERLSRFQIAVKNACVPFEGIVWEEGRAVSGYIASRPLPIEKEDACRVGVCLPAADVCLEDVDRALEKALSWLNQQKITFRIVPEIFLTTDWDGLDDLLVIPEGVSPQGKRKLQGFCAAGGRLVVLANKPMGFSEEVLFSDWIQISPPQRHRDTEKRD